MNVRLNIWYDQRNYERMVQLAGEYFAEGANTQNTVFCLFEPDAAGLTAETFPSEQSVWFGTRPGNRMPVCCSVEAAPEQTKRISTELLAKLFVQRRINDTRDEDPDPELIERMIWEYRRSQDPEDFAGVMRGLAREYPQREAASASVPTLPVMPDLMQALNMAAADSRAVLVLVAPADAPNPCEQELARLVFEPGIAGRAHVVRQTPAEWDAARTTGQITGEALGSGLAFVAPDPYGLEGRVQAVIPGDAHPDRLRAEIEAALDRFRGEWRKLDRRTHLDKGGIERIVWSEYDPKTGVVQEIPMWEPKGKFDTYNQRRYLERLLESRGLGLTEVLETLGMTLASEGPTVEELRELAKHLNALPSLAQRSRIADLAAELELTEARAAALVEREGYGELTHDEAAKLIELLEARKAEQVPEQAAGAGGRALR